jgi:hypothetical protein
MVPKVQEVRYKGDYRVWLKFSDGIEGEIDLREELWGPIFEPLKEKSLFSQLSVDSELGTLVWPNGADFAPEFLYQKLCPEYVLKPTTTSGTV